MSERQKQFWGWVLVVIGTILLSYGIYGIVQMF